MRPGASLSNGVRAGVDPIGIPVRADSRAVRGFRAAAGRRMRNHGRNPSQSDGNGAACHAQMYTMGTLLRHGSDAQKARYLPKIADGELRLQAFGVTEPTSGTDTTRIRDARRVRDGITTSSMGEKVFISRVEHSDLMLLLVRTTPREQCAKPTRGLVRIARRSAGVGRSRPHRQPDQDHDESLDDRALVPGSQSAGGEPHCARKARACATSLTE